MNNGITINGKEYEIVESSKSEVKDGKICPRCALKDVCNEHAICIFVFGDYAINKHFLERKTNK